MADYHVFYNPKSGSAEKVEETLKQILPDDNITFSDITNLKDVEKEIQNLHSKENIILAGGDGTLNHFVNDVDCDKLKRTIYYWACGTGNDFLADIGIKTQTELLELNKYLVKLPTVEVNGKTYKFLNGVGFGIDGYCCEEGDRQRNAGISPVNYTAIAIKGILFNYKPTNATITIDGNTQTVKKVWLAPSMHGRMYGGGMIAAPEQDRLASEKQLTLMMFHGHGRVPTLAAFPSIFEGKHVEKKMVTVKTGKDIKVEFDRPVALQIDGETISNVTCYHAKVFND
ncbi:MAG: hypothetical protein MJ169_01100 [Treponema sp.]|nr:hypothetical protein [Treponema sp.]